jgi:thiamine pyrophosphate-dependent acetolactate synthase large subunit-like protein
MQAVSKKVFEVKEVESIPEVLNEAMQTALTPRCGPVHVDMPRDILGKSAEFNQPTKFKSIPALAADEENLKKAVKLLSEAHKPVILVGAGVKNYGTSAADSVLKLAELLNAPCTTSPGHGDAIPYSHPLNAGSAGPRGSGLGTKLLREADVILVLGSRLGFNTTFYSYENLNEKASIIQCEIDLNSIGRYFPVEVGIHADAKTVADELCKMLETHKSKKEVQDWLDQFKDNRKNYFEKRDANADTESVPILPSGLFKELRGALPEDCVVTLDAGTMCLQLTDALQYHQPKSLFSPLDFGLVGFSYPAGLGIKLAAPERPVVSFHGDGGMSMVIPELSTAIENNINTVVCVMNNGTWGAEAAYQKDFFEGRFIGAHITTPEFDKVAELYGCKGIKVEKAGEIGDAIKAGIDAECPTVIDVQCSPDALYSFRQDSFKHKVKQ